MAADLRLVRDLVDGRWDDDRYLVLQPGDALRMTWDDAVMGATRDDAADGRDGDPGTAPAEAG